MSEGLAELFAYTCIHTLVGVWVGNSGWDRKTGIPYVRVSTLAAIVIALLIAGISFYLSVVFDNAGIFFLEGSMFGAFVLALAYNSGPKVIADRQAAIALKRQEQQAEQRAKEQAELRAQIEGMKPVAASGQNPQLSEAARQVASELDQIFKK